MYWSKICVFSLFLHTRLVWGYGKVDSARIYCMKVGVKKIESLPYQTVEPFDPTIISFESIPTCDRQTDGQTDTDGRADYS